MRAQNQTLLIASASGFLAVSLGAFGAHSLKDVLISNNKMDTYELAVRYHFYHTLVLLGIGILQEKFPGMKRSAFIFMIGTLLFSGSLYALCLLNISKVAFITPIGGLFLLAGWASLFFTLIKSNK